MEERVKVRICAYITKTYMNAQNLYEYFSVINNMILEEYGNMNIEASEIDQLYQFAMRIAINEHYQR